MLPETTTHYVCVKLNNLLLSNNSLEKEPAHFLLIHYSLHHRPTNRIPIVPSKQHFTVDWSPRSQQAKQCYSREKGMKNNTRGEYLVSTNWGLEGSSASTDLLDLSEELIITYNSRQERRVFRKNLSLILLKKLKSFLKAKDSYSINM